VVFTRVENKKRRPVAGVFIYRRRALSPGGLNEFET
jgi:hypothetical protein